MQDQTVQWDLRTIQVHSSGLSQVFVLYILAVLFAGCWKIARVWRILITHLPSEQNGYILELKKVTRSIRKWTEFTFLIWGLYVCLLIAKARQVWVTMTSHYLYIWPSILHEIASFTAAMLFIVTILHLGRWSVEKRVDFLSGSCRS